MSTTESLLEQAQKLPRQKGRDVDYRRYHEDPGILVLSSCWPYVHDVAETIPVQILLEATKKLELELIGRALTNGYQPRVCGNSKGLIEDKSIGHVIEHAVIAVLNNNVLPSETCSGGVTLFIGEGLPDFDILIAIPPSITQKTAEQEVENILKQIHHQFITSREIDLSAILLSSIA